MSRPAFRRQGWRSRAACAGADPEIFFPGSGQLADPAKAACAACPVRGECLAHALSVPELYGTWGGLDQDELRALRRGTGSGDRLRMCGNGLHLMDGPNTYTEPSTGRDKCRACSREWDRRARAVRRYQSRKAA